MCDVHQTVDATSRPCPWPIVELAKAMRVAPPGAVLLLLATDRAAEADVRAWCDSTGHQLLELDASDRVIRALVCK